MHRAHLALLHDVFMAALAFAASVYLRLGPDAHVQMPEALTIGLGVFTGIAALVFRLSGLYRGIWRYASLDDVIAIVKAATLVVLLTTLALFLVTRGQDIPRSSLVMSWFLLIFLLVAPRLGYRAVKDKHIGNLLRRTPEAGRIPVLLIGAGDEAELFIRAMGRPGALYRVIGIIDDKGRRIGQSIRGVAIHGRLEDIDRVVQELADRHIAPQRLILARDHLPPDTVRAMLEVADRLALPLARLPKLTDFRRDHQKIDPRPIDIEDLLGRPQAALDREAVARLVNGKRVLVTGAGGSIGGELVRQLARLSPAALTLVEQSEFALYSIDRDLAEQSPDVPRHQVLADIRSRERMAQIFAEAAPQIVFHAAALKHVPMAEAAVNIPEYVLTNVIGTRTLSDLCLAHGVEAMVMISTDKAVNPTNIMGATKRLAESWCQALDLGQDEEQDEGRSTRFITVRFGNVLGSTGSVVPLFQRQLAAGGPLTVTHPDMTRYFMTIREAVELVLQAATIRTDAGRICVLDMGEPVRIVDLARQMIRLHGLRPDTDVEIVFTGLRPGEKLYEELFHDAEALAPTPVPGVRLAAPRAVDRAVLGRALDELEALARRGDAAAALRQLCLLVPEFTPDLAPGLVPGTADAALGSVPPQS